MTHYIVANPELQNQFHTPAASPPRLAEPRLEMLKQMFPEIEHDVLQVMLDYHSGDVEQAVASILDTAGPTEPDSPAEHATDEDVARALQHQLDEEVARNLQQELHAEARAAADARSAQEPIAQAAVAMQRVGNMTKSLLQRAVRPLSARKTSTHGTRLLDGADSADATPAFDFTPITLPAYQAPPAATEALPVADISDGASEVAAAPSSAARYNARLDRARSANSNRASMSRTSQANASSPPLAPLVASPLVATAPHVPEGELI